MRSHNGSIDTTRTPPSLSFYNTFKTGLDGIYLPMQLTDWLLVVEALLLIGLTQISFVKNWFSLSFRLSAYRQE
jgi:hypothetical protein